MIELYNKYIEARDEYLTLVEIINSSIIDDEYKEDNNIKLKASLKNFEKLNESLSEIEEDSNDLKDFKYLLFDTLLFSSDLSYFYENKNVERFKMRVVNYTNKLKREEVFGGMNKGKCRV
ncbi:MAG: hypothetical protein ACRC7N_05090 [Clostridium sp.]